MCCFTQAVDRVSNTSIFVRGVNGRQVIVYSMAYAARSDLAMVLPLPVPPSPPEDAVRFINLAEDPQFFVDMERAFVHEALGKKSLGPGELVELYSAPVPLVVHEVGAFEASFVLTLFPTLHVHDGTVHPGADFDHVLYCQPEPGWDHAVHLRNWSWSRGPASRFLDASKAQGLVSPKEHLFRLPLAGRRQNRDTWVSIDSSYPDLVPS